MPKPHYSYCVMCGTPITARPGRGRPRETCSQGCRQARSAQGRLVPSIASYVEALHLAWRRVEKAALGTEEELRDAVEDHRRVADYCFRFLRDPRNLRTLPPRPLSPAALEVHQGQRTLVGLFDEDLPSEADSGRGPAEESAATN